MSTAAPVLIGGADYCLPIEVPLDKDLWDVDKTWVIIAAIVGFILGALIAICCAFCCLKDKYGKESGGSYTDEERYVGGYESNKQYDETQQMIANGHATPQKKAKRKKKGGIKRKKRGESSRDDYDPLAPIVPISLSMPEGGGDFGDLFSKGLGFAMIQPNVEAMDAELANQDLNAIEELDMEFKEENLNTMVQMLRVLLMRQMSSQKIPEEDMKAMMADMQQNVSGLITKNQKDKQQEEKDIRKRYSNDPDKMDDELEKLHPKYTHTLNTALQDEKDRIRRELGKNSDLTAEEVDAIMSEFSANMSTLERKQSEERSRQAAALEDRLAQRKQKIEMHHNDKEQERAEIDYRRDAHDKKLTELVHDGRLNEKQKQDILDEYENGMRRAQGSYEEEIQRQKQKLAEQLEKKRRSRMEALTDKQEQERDAFSNESETIKSGDALVQKYHDLLQAQREERQETERELDIDESKQINDISKKNTERRQDSFDDEEKRLYDALQTKGLGEDEANRIMQDHEQDMEDYEHRKRDERQRMKEALKERLEKRKMKAAEKTAEANLAEEQLTDQQGSTITKVLSSQVELDGDVKDKILKQHDEQMAAVNNQIQMSRLRQQKQMEKKLAARKAKLGAIKEKQEQAKLLKTKDREKELAKLQKQLDDEQDKIRAEKANRLEALRKRLADETQQAILEQEKQMGALIGRLQAGAARRQAIIKKNEEQLAKLEDGITNKVEEKAVEENVDERQVNQVLQQHYNQVNDLESRLQDNKARQDAAIKERIEAKKLKKQRNLDKNISREANEERQQQRERGAGLATAILGQSYMEQKHKMLLDQLEKDMHKEMMQQREELNREMDATMAEELEDQRKNFLAQLAAISNISKTEMKDIVGDAVYDAGGDNRDAKKLNKEMQQEMTRAKSSIGGRRHHDDDDAYRRTRSAGDDNYDRPPSSRPPNAREGFADERY